MALGDLLPLRGLVCSFRDQTRRPGSRERLSVRGSDRIWQAIREGHAPRQRRRVQLARNFNRAALMQDGQRRVIPWDVEVYRNLERFSERMHCARSPGEVFATLAECSPKILRCYAAHVFVPAEPGFLGSASAPAHGPMPQVPMVRRSRALGQAGLVTEGNREVQEGGAFEAWRELFERGEIAAVAHTPIGQGKALVMVDRRRTRAFAREDWYLLRALCDEAEVALQECRSEPSRSEVPEAEASRWPRAVLNYAWTCALRGSALTVGVMQLRMEDARADHEPEQEFCRSFAQQARPETSTHQLVVRVGRGRLLALLPGLSRTEAEEVLRRAHQAMEVQLPVQMGLAEYEWSVRSIQQLVQQAERKLWQSIAA